MFPLIQPEFYGPSYGTYLIKQGYSPTTIVGTPEISPGNYTIYGNSQPDFQTSWSNTISFFNGFSLSGLLDLKKGGDILNITLYNTDNGGTTKDWNEDGDKDDVVNGLQRQHGNASSYVNDGGYLRLREAALSYSVPGQVVKSIFRNNVNQIQLGFSATNLFTITKYKGYDPEVSSFGTNAINTGSDLFNYPSSKRFLFNLKVDF